MKKFVVLMLLSMMTLGVSAEPLFANLSGVKNHRHHFAKKKGAKHHNNHKVIRHELRAQR
ncbi:MAG: hypothetical protein ACHQRM_02890 [Bacteroidia bacterium]